MSAVPSPAAPGAAFSAFTSQRANKDLSAATNSVLRMVLDDLSLPPMERLRLTRELASIRKDLAANPGVMAKLKLAQRLAAVRKALGVVAAPVPPAIDENSPPPIDLLTGDDMEEVAEGKKPRLSTSQFYDFDPNRKPAQRKLENAAAMAIIAQINEGALKPGSLTDAQKEALAKYSGTGGNLTGADGKKGSAYEYYTPKPIAEGMWALLRESGFSGGRVLDPCSAVGVFGATAPVNAAIDAIELNETSGRVNQLVNDGPGYKTTIAPFEQVASATPDETYDAIITNVPFGEVADRGGNQFKDAKYQKEPIQSYFLLRSLEKLRPGGLACFITPPRCVSGKGGKDEELRIKCSYMAEFIGAYRLPNSVFGTAAADTMTDVMLFRKFDRATLEKVEELREQDPQVLKDAGVLWAEFIDGTYFQGQGLRHILGTMSKAKGQWGEKDVLNSDLSMPDIAKLMRKFPDSHINWELLNAKETAPIVYNDGDTIRHAGQTLEMIDGRWHAIESAGSMEADSERAELLARLQTPIGAVNNGIEFDAASAFCAQMVDLNQALDIPDWMRPLVDALNKKVVAPARAANWQAAACGLAIDQVMGEHQAEEVGFNYLEGYAVLSDLMKRVLATAKAPATGLPMSVKNAMRKVAVNYSKTDGYSAVWRGDVVTENADSRTDAQKYEAERYQAGGTQFVPIDKAREVYGPTFDPMGSEEWCLGADGLSVAKADDYYVGNYGDFLAKIDAEIAAATDDTIRDKLLTQKRAAAARVNTVDVSRMHFTLFTPFAKLEEKAEFLRRFVDSRFSVGFDEETGEPGIIFEISGSPKNERDKLLKRFALYLNGSRLTLGGIETSDAAKAIAELRRIATTADSQFNSWVKANTVIMGRMGDVANDPARLYFRQVDDDSALTIPGIHPDWAPKVTGYQNAWVRRMGREFGGINGFGVGLGKTSSALIAVQHAHSVGTKKKSIFVVPNSVLSNWRKEAARVYSGIDDCLYVGLREQKDGSFKTDPGAYDQDLNRILENRHRKIFMTYEAFGRLRLRDTTAQAYDVYLAQSDASYAASDSKKADEKGKSRRAALIDQLTNDSSKSMGAPFFEDLGIDSLVIDEGHFLKNSRETVEFKGGKFLSLADSSARGLDAQAKAWYVRKDTPRKDGVILLTATPITNSPLEIYSMLSLAVGDAKLNDLMLGIKGADQFMEVMCEMENQDEETLDGLIKPYDVFVGLNNVDVLRKALDACCTIRTAEQVGEQIVMPDADQKTVNVDLPQSVVGNLIEYKGAFRWAIDKLSGKKENRGDQQAYERVAAKFGEPEELIGHPFNLINKMALLIADPELDQRATFYTFTPPQKDKVEALVSAWNAKAPTEDRAREAPHTRPEAVVGTKTKKDGEDKITLLKIKVLAHIDGQRVVLDTMDAQNQAAFETMAGKQGVDFDVTIPPKLAALLENFQFEEANPRGKHRIDGQVIASGRVRQLIFCDMLPMHAKIKRLLSKKCGIPASSIVIVTGKSNGKPEEILEVQDGFNEESKDNKYRVVIANEKAEVGINLQKGTQAIHHLTLGWTPDSLTQRDGRGVRQGNETGRVNVYHYDAGGTFDSYKRMLVGKKSSWIENVMDPDGGDHVSIEGGLSREKMEAMIDTVGDSDGMSRAQAREEAESRAAREVSTRGKQIVNLSTLKAQQEFVAANATPVGWAADKIGLFVALRAQKFLIEARIDNPKATASAVLKNKDLLAEIEARLKGLRRVLDQSVTVYEVRNGNRTNHTLDDWLRDFTNGHRTREDKAMKVGDLAAKRVRDTMGDRSWGYKFEVSEESDIGNEWQSEVDMANAMIDSSMQDFKRLGKQDGGMSDLVLARFATGDAAIFDGNVVCVGAFMEHGEYLGVVRKIRGVLHSFYWDENGRNKALTVSDDIRKATVTLPGAPGFDALVTRAAKLEDKLTEGGDIDSDKVKLLYSAEIPEVAQRRSKPLVVTYSTRSYGLPPPYVSAVMPHDLSGDGFRVVPMIAAKQKAIVVETDTSRGYFVQFKADSAAGIVEAAEDSVLWRELRDWALANKVRITSEDFGVMASSIGSNVPLRMALGSDGVPEFKSSVIDGADSPAAMRERLMKWLQDDVFPAYDLSTNETAKTNPLSFLYQVDSNLRWAYDDAVRKLEAAARAAEAAKNPAPVVPVVPPVVTPDQEDQPAPPTVEEGDPMRMVGITGNTKKWYSQIKACASMVGGRAVWDGANNCWNAPHAAWLKLLSMSPNAGQELQVVEASGKTNYKRAKR